jgi:hypothetical protein
MHDHDPDPDPFHAIDPAELATASGGVDPRMRAKGDAFAFIFGGGPAGPARPQRESDMLH